jgi:hypothetical protein
MAIGYAPHADSTRTPCGRPHRSFIGRPPVWLACGMMAVITARPAIAVPAVSGLIDGHFLQVAGGHPTVSREGAMPTRPT